MNRILRYVHRYFYHSSSMTNLENLKFDNLVLRSLPIDLEERNYVRTVNQACFSKVRPTPVENPKTVAYSPSAMKLLGLSVSELEREDFAAYFSGNKLLPGSDTAAHCYCGHQFGFFSGQLGDGAAMYLGEILNEKNERWEIQLKGAGLTPYSRTADGRKVLRSSIREFLCSEAMHFLGIPTTRAGACVTSDSKVVRDINYDGHPIKERCTIVLRIAPTFIRFGSFEIFKTLDPTTRACGPSVGRTEILISMLDYVIDTFYPEVSNNHSSSQIEKYAAFYKEIVLSTARLVAMWQCVGFCHGVLNTDNMSIVGLTLDYGPYGFMDMYNADHVCNGSDDAGRYTFSKQPEICRWNLLKLSEAIQKALPLSESAPLLDLYDQEFQNHYLEKMRNKLGLISLQLSEDIDLVKDLLNTMENTASDFTNTFLCLHHTEATGSENSDVLLTAKQQLLEQCFPLEVMVSAWNPNVSSTQTQMLMMLAKKNPEMLKQFGRAGDVIKRLITKSEKVEQLKQMKPDNKTRNDNELWNNWLKKYKHRVEKDFESSGLTISSYNERRLNIMNNNNPRFILRNYILQSAIEEAEKGNYSEVKKLLAAIEKPYDRSSSTVMSEKSLPSNIVTDDDSRPSTSYQESYAKSEVLTKVPDWAFTLKVT